MIRVMVVDDQASARMGLSMMVGRDPGLSVVATADDGGAALAELARRKDAGEPLPDVVVSDVRMPGTGGVTLAREVASRGVTVNAVAPGFIQTDMTAGMNETALQKGLAAVPMGRIGKPEDVANAVVLPRKRRRWLYHRLRPQGWTAACTSERSAPAKRLSGGNQ